MFFLKDSAVRILPLLVTVLVVISDTDERVKEYVTLISFFNISVIVFNFGRQFYASIDPAVRKSQDRIHLFSIVLLLSFMVLFKAQIIFCAVAMGIVYSRLNEFRLRRNGHFSLLFISALIVALPRLLAFFLDWDYLVVTAVSSFLLVILVSTGRDEYVAGDKVDSLLNYAFLTSVLYVLYQQIPGYIAILDDVSAQGRAEQVLGRLVFAFMFLKSSLVVFLIKHRVEYKQMTVVELFGIVFCCGLMFFLESGLKQIVIACGVFVWCELRFSVISAGRHEGYNYKSFLVDNSILFGCAISLAFLGNGLMLVFSVSSACLLLARGRRFVY